MSWDDPFKPVSWGGGSSSSGSAFEPVSFQSNTSSNSSAFSTSASHSESSWAYSTTSNNSGSSTSQSNFGPSYGWSAPSGSTENFWSTPAGSNNTSQPTFGWSASASNWSPVGGGSTGDNSGNSFSPFSAPASSPFQATSSVSTFAFSQNPIRNLHQAPMSTLNNPYGDSYGYMDSLTAAAPSNFFGSSSEPAAGNFFSSPPSSQPAPNFFSSTPDPAQSNFFASTTQPTSNAFTPIGEPLPGSNTGPGFGFSQAPIRNIGQMPASAFNNPYGENYLWLDGLSHSAPSNFFSSGPSSSSPSAPPEPSWAFATTSPSTEKSPGNFFAESSEKPQGNFFSEPISTAKQDNFWTSKNEPVESFASAKDNWNYQVTSPYATPTQTNESYAFGGAAAGRDWAFQQGDSGGSDGENAFSNRWAYESQIKSSSGPLASSSKRPYNPNGLDPARHYRQVAKGEFAELKNAAVEALFKKLLG